MCTAASPAGSPLVIEPPEEPAPSGQVPVPIERIVPEVAHTVQPGIVSEPITLPRPDDEILFVYDEDV